MTKKDLKVGMVVELTDYEGTKMAMVCELEDSQLCISGEKCYMLIDELTDDLRYDKWGAKLSINKVYGLSRTPKYASVISNVRRDLLWERSTYYNGKVVCSYAYTDDLTVGKIYTFVDGMCKADNDCVFSHEPFKNFEDLNRRLVSKFIEVVN